MSSASLLGVAGALWNEAYRLAASNNLADIERALRCLYAGLELVLPTAIEIRFRLLLSRLLELYTDNAEEAFEQLRKTLQLIQTRADCPVQLRFLCISMWSQSGLTFNNNNQWHLKHLLEARSIAISGNQFDWWMHFDWILWRKGRVSILQESLKMLEGRSDSQNFCIFLQVLISYCDNSLILKNLEPQILNGLVNNAEDQSHPIGSLNPTIAALGLLVCLKERIERGDIPEARTFYEVYNRLNMNMTDGSLPGFLSLDLNVLRALWTRLAATMSLRLGDPPADSLKRLIPQLFIDFKIGMNSKDLTIKEPPPHHLPSIPNINSKSGPYSYKLEQLMTLFRRCCTSTDARRTLFECKSITVDCPNLEALKTLIEALALYHSGQPIHHVKASLLSVLKILNNTTQNTQMKIIVLLLVGRLYLDTDFSMAAKMAAAAYSFAATAQWDFWAFLSAELLAATYNLLADTKKYLDYTSAASLHREKWEQL